MIELKQKRDELDGIVSQNNNLTLQRKSAEIASRTLMAECK